MNDTTDGRQAPPGARDFVHGWQGEARPISPATVVAGNSQILFDQTVFTTPPTQLFDPQRLHADGLLTGEATGRGKAWFLRYQGRDMVLRHFRRGGLMERFLVDRYWGQNPANSRAWREWHLLLRLYRRGLPVPRPLAARVVAGKLFYRADLLTAAIPDADSLADHLTSAALAAGLWQRLGAAIALFHRHAVYHPDLNARNILFDRHEQIFLIDFDQGRFRTGLNAEHNLERLQRSLRKFKQNNPGFHYDETTVWPLLLAGYRQGRQHPDPDNLTPEITRILNEQKKPRTFSLTHQGAKIWVKQAAPGRKNLWHTILLVLSKITKNPYLTPTVVTSPEKSLLHEGGKLTELRAAGINVPRVLLINEQFLVLDDAGNSVKIMLESSDEQVKRQTKLHIVRQLSSALATMHNVGLYHSRPALRDITYKDGQIYFVDFEENLDAVLSTDQAIIRDTCIYIHTLFRALKDPGVRDEALGHYVNALAPAIWAMTHNEAQKHRLLYALLKLIYPWLGKDGRAMYDMLNFILSHPADKPS